jgi:hypothetical protein
VVITTYSGVSATGPSDQFTYPGAPSLSAISVSSGSTGGGTVLTITGNNLIGAAGVFFGSTFVPSFTVNSNTQLTVTAPPHAAGTWDVTVVTPSGTSAISTADRFTYNAAPAPALTGLSLTTGSTGGGAVVLITGTNFSGAKGVSFGSFAATRFTVNSDTLITAVVPPQPAGIVDIRVTTYSGTSATGTADRFTYNAAPAPAISLISPTTGSTVGGTMVTILGSNFTGATGVNFGSTAAIFYHVISDTAITALAPANAAGSADIRVTTYSGTSAVVAADRFTYVAPPVPAVTSLSTSSSSTAGGTALTITGSGFTNATAVYFGTRWVSSFTVNSDTLITLLTSAHAAGTWDVTVSTPGGTSALVAADRFTYNAAPAPAITSISPATGNTGGGTIVTLNGSNFTGAVSVAFGMTAALSFTVRSDSQIVAIAPPCAAGVVDVRVSTYSGISAPVAADRYTYTAAPVPAVTGITPASGTTAGGTIVTISGSGFTGATSVSFGSAAASFRVLSDSTIVATSVPQAAGQVHITVKTYSGTSSSGAADLFTYNAAPVPVVSGITATSGSMAGGTPVTITGSNFTGATAVKFGTTRATSFTIYSDRSIVAVAPYHAGGAVDVTVTTFSGTSATGTADLFTYVYVPAAAPAITGIAPTSGTNAGGTVVILSGTSFTGATSVLFGMTPAASFTVLSDSQISAISPAATGIVHISVTTPSGTSLAGSADLFTYVAAPVPAVSSLSANSGSTAGGTAFTINGSGFTGVTKVCFGSTPANFTFVSDAQITVTAPPHAAGLVDVTVQTPAGTSVVVPADQFTYTLGPVPTLTTIGPNSGSTAGGTQVTLTGTN